MKKDDELPEGHTNNDEDLFDLSLDDLEPEDTIVEPHVGEADEEIIELIDLVEKGNIALEEEEIESSPFFKDLDEQAEGVGDEQKADETPDLFDVTLDEGLNFDEFEGEEKGEEGIEAIELSEMDFELSMEKETDQPEDIGQVPEGIFEGTADESAQKEVTIDETFTSEDRLEIVEVPETDIEIHKGPEPTAEEDKTVRIFKDEAETPEPVEEIKFEEPEQAPAPSIEEEKVEEEPAFQETWAYEEVEIPQGPPPDSQLTGISEEQIEAVLRKVAEEVMERVARETMTNVSDKIAQEANEMVERVARETITSVAEKIITDTIDVLKKSIESTSDQTVP